MNDKERRLWIMNNEGLYKWYLSHQQSLTQFINEHRAELTKLIEAK